VDSVWLSLWGVLAAVGIIWLFGWLLVVYETRRSARIEAERAAEHGNHATN